LIRLQLQGYSKLKTKGTTKKADAFGTFGLSIQFMKKYLVNGSVCNLALRTEIQQQATTIIIHIHGITKCLHASIIKSPLESTADQGQS
jgi:hypothetical protein